MTRRNLPPQAEPWGREVDARLRSLENLGSRNDLETLNALKGVNSSLRVISQQIERLDSVVTRLDEQQQELSRQQAYLSSLVSVNAATGAWTTSWHALGVPASTWYWRSGPQVTVNVSTGKARIFLRSDFVSARRNQSNGTVTAGISYGVSGGVAEPTPGTAMKVSAAYSGAVSTSGSSGLMRVGTLTMTPGTYTFTGYYGMMAQEPTAEDGQTASFEDLAIVVEVVNPE